MIIIIIKNKEMDSVLIFVSRKIIFIKKKSIEREIQINKSFQHINSRYWRGYWFKKSIKIYISYIQIKF